MGDGSASLPTATPGCNQHEVPDRAGGVLQIASTAASVNTSRSSSRSTSRYPEEFGDGDVLCYGSVMMLSYLNSLDLNADAVSSLT
jgi:hypothetical protein